MRISSVVVLAAALVACKGESKPAPVADKAIEKAPLPKPEAPAASALTETDAATYGKAFTAALAKCDGDAIDALIDTPEVNKRIAMGGVNVNLGPYLCKGLGDDFHVRYAKVVTVDGAPRPRIRVIVGKGVNFVEPVLEKKDGKVLAYDIYTFRQGELMSHAIGGLSSLQNDLDAARAFIDAQNLYTQKKYADAQRRFLAIPEKDRASIKALALLGVSIAEKLDTDTYQKSMADFAKNFPGDTALPLIQIDAYYLAKQHDKLIAALEAFLARLGDDAYVRSMLAGARSDAGDKAGAFADAKASLAAEPELADARIVLFDAAVDVKDYDEALVALDASAKNGDDLAAIAGAIHAGKQYAGFVKSSQWKTWSAAHSVK